jgi:hypothetical protein
MVFTPMSGMTVYPEDDQQPQPMPQPQQQQQVDDGLIAMLAQQQALMSSENEEKDEPLTLKVPPSVKVSDKEEQEIISLCNTLKTNFQSFYAYKKQRQRRSYAYLNSKLMDDDLLPTLGVEGSQRDAKTNRPNIFMPMSRQQAKLIYSQLKLTIFPNDKDYFRLRGKSEEASKTEDEKTDALKDLFRKMLLTEKGGIFLWQLIWAGEGCAMPSLNTMPCKEWHYNPNTQKYKLESKELEPELLLDVLNPLDFYIDPKATNPENARWMHCGLKTVNEFKSSGLYMNTENLANIGKHETTKQENRFNVNTINSLNQTFIDVDKNLDYDLFYFPVLELENETYYKMLVGIAQGQKLVRFSPNIYPDGLNPVVFCNYAQLTDTLSGIGPLEDIIDLQRTINFIVNHAIETMSRTGSRFIANEGVDFSSMFGLAGGVAYTEEGVDVNKAVAQIGGNSNELATLMNFMGMLKAEGQITTGSQNPFQGSSQVDFQKTATELQILNENSMSITREIVEHIVNMGIRRIIERLVLLVGAGFQEYEYRSEKKEGGFAFNKTTLQGLNLQDYDVELVNVNPAQSKMAQINNLTKLLEICAGNPMLWGMLRDNGYHLITKLQMLQGDNDIEQIMYTPTEFMELLSNAQSQQPPQEG